MLQALRSLEGIGRHVFLPTSLPPLLENLECNAETSEYIRPNNPQYDIENLEAAAKAVCGLGNLRWLTVRRCLIVPLPLSFVSQLPVGVQVSCNYGPCWSCTTREVISCTCSCL